MRFLAAAAIWAASVLAQTSSLQRAEQELAHVRELVAAGAAPASRLAEAEQNVADARDEMTLAQVLYGKLEIEELTEAQSEEMLAAATRRVDRVEKKITQRKKLVEEGVAAANTLAEFQAELERRQETLTLARGRARLIEELAALASTEAVVADAPRDTPDSPWRAVERFDGENEFTNADFKRLVLAFEKEFGKPLPVSARGDTALHRSLGFDHRGRIDVALNPAQQEGAWLLRYLQERDFSYYAFRMALAGRSTGPHIHIGPGSTRLAAGS